MSAKNKLDKITVVVVAGVALASSKAADISVQWLAGRKTANRNSINPDWSVRTHEGTFPRPGINSTGPRSSIDHRSPSSRPPRDYIADYAQDFREISLVGQRWKTREGRKVMVLRNSSRIRRGNDRTFLLDVVVESSSVFSHECRYSNVYPANFILNEVSLLLYFESWHFVVYKKDSLDSCDNKGRKKHFRHILLSY